MNVRESLDNAIYEEVELCAYNPEWPCMFEAERSRLLALFPGEFLAIEHFGSTAIPGLIAKPVIDILAGVESISQADALIEPLCRSKYTTSAEFNSTLRNRRWLMRWANGHRTHHLHLVVHGESEWQRRLVFRDVLRSNSELAARYTQLKRRLAEEFKTDREAYTKAKSQFVLEVLENHET